LGDRWIDVLHGHLGSRQEATRSSEFMPSIPGASADRSAPEWTPEVPRLAIDRKGAASDLEHASMIHVHGVSRQFPTYSGFSV
jgi:hypothetical protein